MYGELALKEGEATILDFDLMKLKQKHLPQLRRKLGVIFQDFQLLSDRTVENNLKFVLKATGWKKNVEITQRIQDVLDLVGMSTKGYKYPHELSGGEQQRIAIARAILNNPEIAKREMLFWLDNLGKEDPQYTVWFLLNVCEKVEFGNPRVVKAMRNSVRKDTVQMYDLLKDHLYKVLHGEA